MKSKGFWTSFLAFVWFAASAGLYGQEIRGLIVGNVTDSSGAAVPGAQIMVKNEDTGITYKTITGTSGTYTVPDLLAGMYTVTAVKEGFQTFEARGIQLLSSQTARQDVVLQVGTVVQTVEVAGHAQLVQTDSPTIGGTLQTRELADLPFMTTSTDGLMNLVPGMSQGITNGNSNPDVGGAAYVGTSNWTVNGISTNNPGQGGGGNVTYIGTSEMIAQANLPAIGTLQEFKVESSVNGAEFRSQTAVTMVTKQGTNKFHGQVYEYNENKSTSANSFDLNKYNESEYPFNRNQFGANVGGPILKDKLFFFVNYDGIREIHPTPVQATFPTEAMRQGDLSNLCDVWSQGLCADTTNGQQLYNPLTGQPFLNNQIPQSMITSQANELSNYLLTPNVNSAPTPGSGGGEFLQGSPYALYDWAGALPLRYGTNNAQMRLDGQLGSKDSVVAFATMSKGAPWFYGFACCPNFGNWSDHGYNWYNLSGTETHTFGPGTINEFRLGAVITAMRSFGENLGVDPTSLFAQMPENGDRGLPTMSISGYQGPYDVGSAHARQGTMDWVDNFTMVRGRHTIKAGIEETGYKENDFCWFTCGTQLGSFTFSGSWTGNLGWNLPPYNTQGESTLYGQSLGNAYADFLLGDATGSSYAAPTNQRMYDREWDFYVQDTFKVAPRLTLSYGVRYMYQRPWTFKDHDATFWDPQTNKLVIQQNSGTVTIPAGSDPGAFAAYPFETTQQIGASLNYFHGDFNNWAPRVGFAFRPSSDNKTVIRGGWGVYYAFNAAWSGPLQSLSNLPWERTAAFSTQLPGSSSTPYLPDITFANPYPSNLIQGEAANPSISAMDQHELNPISQQWNLTLERQLGNNWGFRASYVGAQGHHLLSQYNNIDRPNVQQVGVPSQQQLPFQPWSAIYWYSYPGTSNFDQLQLEVQKRFASGLSFRTEYDWSRNLTNVNADAEAGGIPLQNPWNLRAEYSNEQFQYRDKFLVYYVYELPVGRGKRWLSATNRFVDAALGGWRVSGITTYHSGDALSPALEVPSTVVGWFATRPDRVAGAPLYAGRQSGHDTVDGVQWLNIAAFAPPQLGAYGNASPYSIFGPGFGDWDLSAMKSFHIPKGEATRLELKVDFFNMPNHYNLGDPDTNIADVRDGGVPDTYDGKITGGAGAYQPRLIQIGLRLMF